MLTVLGAVFSSWRIYMLIGIALAAAALFAYVEYLRADAANAHAALSGAQATISVQGAALDTDQATILDLQTERAADQAALRSTAAASQQIATTLSSIKDTINAIPEPKACQRLDLRDRAVIDGVRKLLAPSAPGPANQDH